MARLLVSTLICWYQYPKYTNKCWYIALDWDGRQKTKNPPITRIKAGLVYFFGLHKTSNWWRRRESNPRPQILYTQIYILSHAFNLT